MSSRFLSRYFGNPESASAAPAPSGRWRHVLPTAFQHNIVPTRTCYDYLGNPKTHGMEQRYVSPTTGICRRLVIQAMDPREPNEHPVRDHTGRVNRLAMWLVMTSPFHRDTFFVWIGTWLLFQLKFLWSFLWKCAQLYAQLFDIALPDDVLEDSEPFSSGNYRPYTRSFEGQLWQARSQREYSTRIKGEHVREREIHTRSLYPRELTIHDPKLGIWKPCTDPDIITNKKYLATSFTYADVFTDGYEDLDKERKKQAFLNEVHDAVLELNFDAYWCDLECVGQTLDEKSLDIYCMSDVYRCAESTLIILRDSGDGEQDAWKRWGKRGWTFPEALLSRRLLYRFRGRDDINTITLHQLGNLAYSEYQSEQAIINAYSGKDPLERLERLTLLKDAIWRRDLHFGTRMGIESNPFSPAAPGSAKQEEGHEAERVYALMGFFEHRIQPNYDENELLALVRLSMVNDNNGIAERMISLLPDNISSYACWYADNDVYKANLWDVVPEVQVVGVTEHGVLVLDGCRAAHIRWKDFPEIANTKSNSMRRDVSSFLPYLAWPILVVGIAVVVVNISIKGGIAMFVVGIVLLVISPKLLVLSESGRVVTAQPWLIGVKGVMDKDTAAMHLYGGGNMGRHRRIGYSPSGSEYATYDTGLNRAGSVDQYHIAKAAEAEGKQMFTLVDTNSSAVYYFRAERPPTVCLFTGREGGLGRFVLCSEKCHFGELHKESVLRMPTQISENMEMCGWLALG